MELKKLQKKQERIFKSIRNDIQNYRNAMLELVKEYEKESKKSIKAFRDNLLK